METINIVLCGLGGQGILFLTKIMARTALDKEYNVMTAETHGMAQRGGSVVSHLRIGDAESSLIRTGTAHFLLALEESEGLRNLPFLSNGAGMYMNANPQYAPADQAADFLNKKEVVLRSVDAVAIAMKLNAPRSSNLALSGYFSAFGHEPFSYDNLRETIVKVSPDRFRDINLEVFDAGYQEGLRDK